MVGSALAISWPSPPSGETAGGKIGSLLYADTGNGFVGIGTQSPSAKLEVSGGVIKASGGLVHESRTDDPSSPADGQVWFRSDI